MIKDVLFGIEGVQDLREAFIKSKDFTPKKYESGTKNILKIIENFIDNDV